VFPEDTNSNPHCTNFKSGSKNIPSNYRTITINPILIKLKGIIMGKKIRIWIETHGKGLKGRLVLEAINQL
jgi:hypothetical protein